MKSVIIRRISSRTLEVLTTSKMFTKKKVLVKDGGFGTQLALNLKESIDNDPLWSARANHIAPEAVIQTHLDFLIAGADLILANTYQASISGYMKHLLLSEQESYQLIKSAVGLAHEARSRYILDYKGITAAQRYDDVSNIPAGNPLILAAIGPYGAHLSDGSEYTGSYCYTVDSESLKDWHKVRIKACIEAEVNGLAIVTIPCQREALALVDLLCSEFSDTQFWISFQCKDQIRLANGEYFHEAVFSTWKQVKKHSSLHNLIAIGVNCLNPKFVTPLLSSVTQSRNEDSENIPFVVFPNSGGVYDKNKGWTGLDESSPLESYAEEWISLGVKVIGGCCHIYPDDISKLRKTVDTLAT